MPQSKWLRRAGISAAILTALLLAACGGKPHAGGPGAGGPMPVGIVVAAAQPEALITELSGRTSPYLVSEVRPQVTGVIRSRLFTEGGYVRKGQSLYQIDSAPFAAALSSAQAGLAQAEAVEGAAKLKADRYKALVAINAVSKQDNDDAQAAWNQAVANVAAQKAAVQQARINLGYTRVVAPISGHVGRSAVTPGALVTAGQAQALVTVQSLDPMYVDLTQSTADLLRLRKEIAAGKVGKATSAPVGLVLEDGTVYSRGGRLEFSDVTVDQGTGTVTLRAVFPNPDGLLLPGMYVRARITTGVAENAILAPQAAVTRDPKGGAVVMVVGPGEKAEARPITVRQTVGDKWLVTSGLKPGDRMIVDGLSMLQPGMPVKATPAPADKAPAASAQN